MTRFINHYKCMTTVNKANSYKNKYINCKMFQKDNVRALNLMAFGTNSFEIIDSTFEICNNRIIY